MRLPTWLLVLSFIFTALGCAAQQPEPNPKQIAITLDDGPVARWWQEPSAWHREQIVDSLITALQRHQAPATLFVIGRESESDEARRLLQRWLAAGVDLENHTYNHPDFSAIPLDSIYEEIEITNRVLAASGADEINYLRVPFLQEGSVERKAALDAYLYQQGMRNAYVSINNQDWKYNAEYSEAEDAGEWEKRYEIGQQYIQHILDAVKYWEDVGQELAGRPVRHVLLLHANRINRDYLGTILDELKVQGYEFVTLDDAYEDPIYQEEDVYVSEGGESFLEHVRQSRKLRGEPTTVPVAGN